MALCAAAMWPVWRWYAARLVSSPDDAWGLLALATALVFLLEGEWRDEIRLALPAALVALYAASYAFVPPLGRAAIALLALAATARGLGATARAPLAAWALVPLSLPLVATAQFYLGFPLRVATAAAAAAMVRMNGFPVVREGTALDWNGTVVLVDAPCSGVRMLWVGLYLTLTLACVYRLGAARTALAASCGVAAVLAGNALRASALFYVETGVVDVPAWTHTGVGLVVFALTAATILACVRAMQREVPCSESPLS